MCASSESGIRVVDDMAFCFGQAVQAPFSTTTAAFKHFALSYWFEIAIRDLSTEVPRQLTYGELALQGQAMASDLRIIGVKPNQRVPLVAKRSCEMIVAIWAILFCGAQYIPLDGDVVPDSTLRHVLNDSNGSITVCTPSTEERVKNLFPGLHVAVAGRRASNRGIQSAGHQWIDLAAATEGCYIIYTSGTTGQPKGVDVMHCNVTNLLCQYPGNLGISPGTRVGQVLNISFDMAAWEIFACLCNGGTLIIRGTNWEPTISQVDVLICTPTILTRFCPRNYPNIQVVATAGEPTTQTLADLWATHAVYWNCCGPTETTIVNTMSKHVPGQLINIGKPTPNNNVYILDEYMQPVGLEETGFVWAGGSGVSRGYVGLAEKTMEAYLQDPFTNDGSRMYRTGDLGKWDVSGNINMLGRCDDQIKIKGFRVELDGISSSLLSAPGVSQAVAAYIDGEIHAFISPTGQDEVQILALVAEQQPYYAIPSAIHQLAHFPVTPNGKIDKNALRRVLEDGRIERSKPVNLETVASDRCSPAETHSLSSVTTTLSEKVALYKAIPNKRLPQPFRGLAYRILVIYRALFTVVVLTNAGVLALLLTLGQDLRSFKLVASANLTLAVLVRQDAVINSLYTVFCSVPKTAPLWIRRKCAKIYHLGGVHSAAGVCSTLWLLGSNIVSTFPYGENVDRTKSTASTVVAWMVSGLCCTMIGFAYPTFRKRNHNVFERTHRFMGWAALLLIWVQDILKAMETSKPGQDIGMTLAKDPGFWLLAVTSCSLASSWLFLRKVPVETIPLSNHAIVLSFSSTVPVNGSFARISSRPLLEWHSFATIPQLEPNAWANATGYSLVVSDAGDWTRSCIEKPPHSLWVRGLPTCGVMRIATLFKSIVVIATGSGIGPLLGHLQRPSCRTELIWSAKHPERTFGKHVMSTINKMIPNAIIHDTALQGRPDLTIMAYNLAVSCCAEAVIIIANEKITKKVVYGLETRGMPAYGAIWDS